MLICFRPQRPCYKIRGRKEKGLEGGARKGTAFLPRWAGSFLNLRRPDLSDTIGTAATWPPGVYEMDKELSPKLV